VVNIRKLGHLEFEVRDLDRMTDFYTQVMGLTETCREAGIRYLSTVIDHHSLVLRQGQTTRLTKIALEADPIGQDEGLQYFTTRGLSCEWLSDSQPGLPRVLRTANTDGVPIEIYSEFTPSSHPYSFRGVDPVKLSHFASLSPDLHRLVNYYTGVLGLRISDSMHEFFYFLRCGADHHTINMVSGNYSAIQHFAFELADVSHLRSACDVLARHGVEILWGPLRHGCGHNLAVYHFDPEGNIIELCTELDRMSNEALGYFDPRPYHEDRPQRPKSWKPKDAIAVWGRFPPPELFNTGLSAAARGITVEENE
jgi:catechol 2,3-dioxygenase-like lactoylglutathione lyase family enzyme